MSKQQLLTAAEHLSGGRFSEALAAAQVVLHQSPGHPEGTLIAALARSQMGEVTSAIEMLSRLTEEQPQFGAAWYNLGVARRQVGDHQASLSAFRRAIALNPADAAAHVNGGAAAIDVGDLELAISLWRKALGLRADDDGTRVNLGNALSRSGDHEEARRMFETALNNNPRNVAALNGMGMTWRAAGNLDAALACYDRALDMSPEDLSIRLNRAKALARVGRFDDSRSDFAIVQNESPSNLEAAMGLSVVDARLGDRSSAIVQARKAVELGQRSPSALFNLAALLSKETSEEVLREAEALLRQTLALDNRMAEAWHCEAQVLQKLGDQNGALQAAQRALSIAEGAPDFAITAAGLLEGTGQVDAAIKTLESAVAANPTVAEARRQLGITQLRDGQSEVAEETLRRAYRLGEDDQRTIAYLGLAKASGGDITGARQWLGSPAVIYETRLPTPEGFSSLDSFNRALADAIRNHSGLRWQPIGLAAVNGALTDDLLADENAATQGFVESLRTAIEQFKNGLAENPDSPFLREIPERYELNVWATLVDAPGQIDTHIHEESWLSGAYYAELPPSMNGAENGQAGWIEFGRPHANDPLVDDESLVDLRKPEEGKLYLFPSYLFHRTLPHRSGSRISVSFDLVSV